MVLLLMLVISSPDAVYLEHKAVLDCSRPDSGYIETTTEIIIPLTARGVQRYAEISASYRNTWESLEVTASISHWRSGRGDDQAIISEHPHSSLLADGRLESTLREVLIEFPGIEIGDTLKVSISRHIRRLPMEDYYSYTFFAASRDSIHRGVFRVLWPPSRGLQIHTEGEFEEWSYSLDNVENIIWESGPQCHVPLLPFSPDPASISPCISISSHNPSEVSSGLYRILDENCMVDSSQTIADSIISIAGDQPADLCGWVSREIEYLSGNLGDDPGYSPRNPVETLETHSGVCRDRAVLLLWLLRRAGHSPFAILTSVSSNTSPLPGSRSFDHMLVALENSEGDTLFLDPTNRFSTEGYTYTLRGWRYLPLTSPGSPSAYFPDESAGDLLSIIVEGSLDESSTTISGRFSVTFAGAADELFRSMLAGVEPSSRNALIERLFGILPGAELIVEGDPSALDEPLLIRGTGYWKCALADNGDSLFLIIPGLEMLDLVSSRAAAFILPEFRQDIYIETPYTARLSMLITGIPSGIPVIPEAFESPRYSIQITQTADNVLEMNECIILDPAVPDENQLADLRTGMLASLSSSFRTVIFRQ